MPKAKAKEQNCGNCRYMGLRKYEYVTASAFMRCHRFPPQLVVFPGSQHTQEFWPSVESYEWCGEWKFKPKNA